MSDLHARSVTELVPALASGKLAVRDLVAALLARVDATDDGIHAWAHLDRDRALADAGRLDALPAAQRAPDGSLLLTLHAASNSAFA